MFGDRTICACVTLVSTKSSLGKHNGSAKFLVALKKTKFRKIARGPATEFAKSLELSFVVVAPARRIGWLCGRLKFNKGAWKSSLSHESDVRPPDTLV